MFATSTVALPSTASADPDVPWFNDPHVPSFWHGHCEGGKSYHAFRTGWCDGSSYPDGSYYRETLDTNQISLGIICMPGPSPNTAVVFHMQPCGGGAYTNPPQWVPGVPMDLTPWTN
ncbi:MAG TPA: hypothetical protein VFR27_03110 [Mycobacterium sp.]|nr:hypothetical protein [Mycobacterium sp.]